MEMYLENVKLLAKELHAGQTDKAGVDYFEGHLTSVAAGVNSEFEKAIAYLHDSIEDTGITPDQLYKRLIEIYVPEVNSKMIVEGVSVLTNKPGESYEIYISRVSKMWYTRGVKKSDLRHNMDLSRLDKVRAIDRERTNKYKMAYMYLDEI